MMAFVPYSGTFEQIINQMLGPETIAVAASKFVELEKQHGPYSFGKFIKYFLPKSAAIFQLGKGCRRNFRAGSPAVDGNHFDQPQIRVAVADVVEGRRKRRRYPRSDRQDVCP